MNGGQLYQDMAKLQSENYQRKCQQYYYDAARGSQQPYNSFGQPQPATYSGDPFDSLAAGAWQSFFG
jgi:hypothetical protein